MSLNNLGTLYAAAGRYDEAEPYYTQTLALRRRVLGDDHPFPLSSLRNLAELNAVLHRYEEAIPLAVESYERLAASRGPEHAETRQALESLISLYEAAGDPDAAGQWRAKAAASRPVPAEGPVAE